MLKRTRLSQVLVLRILKANDNKIVMSINGNKATELIKNLSKFN